MSTKPTITIHHRDPQDLRPHADTKHLHMLAPESVQFMALVRSIQNSGFDPDKPITITPDGSILDGRHRWKAAKQLGLDSIPCIIREESDAATVILNSIVSRKHFTKSAIAFEVYPLFKDAHYEAQARHIEKLKNANVSSSPLAAVTRPKRVEDLAASIGISADLFQRAAKVHHIFSTNPEYAAEMLPRIYAEPIGGEHEDTRPVGLGAVIAGFGGGKAKQKPKHLINQLELFSESVTATFLRWSKIDDVQAAIPQIKKIVADLPHEQCVRLETLVDELRAAIWGRSRGKTVSSSVEES